MHNSLRLKVLLWFLLFLACIICGGWIGYMQLSRNVEEEAQKQMKHKLDHVVDVLRATDLTYSRLLKASGLYLKQEAEEHGRPHLRQNAKGEALLFYGEHEVGAANSIVDRTKEVMGGTATLFVRRGDDFVRQSTNIRNAKGERATGTSLNPKGKAAASLLKGEAFFGLADILDTAYLTAYKPIFDDSRQVIGCYYVGYALNTLEMIDEAIGQKGVLDRGFFALANAEDRVVFQTEHAGLNPTITMLAQDAAADRPNTNRLWFIKKETFEPWDYDIVAGLYWPDVRSLTLAIIWRVYGVVGFVLAGLLTVSYWLTRRLSISLEETEVSREEALQARDAAESANRTKSAFLANMSHELRTPMNAIIGYSEMLIEEAEDMGYEELKPDLDKIRSAGTHLLALINDVLDLSKIEAGKMTLYNESFDINAMLGDVFATIQPLFQKNENRLIVKRDEELGVMVGDLTKVRQTLFNLLSNATKFTEKGTITVDARRLHGDEAAGGDRIVITVQDTGIGMSAEQLAKLFKAFTQADESTTRKYGGTGLGLVISQKFCQMMGGHITAESTLGEGSRFTVSLPCTAPSEEKTPALATPPAVTVPSRRTDRPTVLVIDDDPTAAELISRSLEKAGYSTLVAADGPTGIDMARQHRPLAITLDVMMPNMDGWSVLGKLKADPELAEIPVIMATMLKDKPLGFALGAADFLSKPVDPAKLRNVLQRLFGAARPQGRVLVVDDDPPSREVLCRLLAREGIESTEAENGREALKIVAQMPFDLILLDLMMPVMDGFDFLALLRNTPETAKLPVVVVTAKELTQADRERLGGSVHQILAKGALDREALLDEVWHLIDIARAATPPPAP